MNPVCERCGGRCCLYFVLRVPMGDDFSEWLAVRADAQDGEQLYFHRRCPQFTDGVCGIHEHKPTACVEHEVSRERCGPVIEYTGGNVDEIFANS